MKIHANSFDVDMNALLNQMNGHRIHGYYNKLINDSAVKVKNIQKNIDKNLQTTKTAINGNYGDLHKLINDKHDNLHQMIDKNYNQLNDLVNGNSKDVNGKLKDNYNQMSSLQKQNLKTFMDNYDKLSKNQRQNVIDLRTLAKGNHEDAVNQINQTWDALKGQKITIDGTTMTIRNNEDRLRAVGIIAKQVSHDMTNQMNVLHQKNMQMWQHAVPNKINDGINYALQHTPTTSTYYYPVGQYPDDPTPGDVCWQIPDPQDLGSTKVKAMAYRYSSDGQWHLIKGASQDVFGANIFGANINGGMITGAAFKSNEQGTDGAPFSVNRDGRLYAREFVSDLEHKIVTPALNECVYYGYLNGDNNDNNEGGFYLRNGLISMYANVVQSTGIYSWDDQSNMKGKTFLEPGYLKLRYLGDLGYVRTDLRAGMLEIAADSWNQNAGIRLGYLDGPGGQSPATLWLDGWYMHEKTNGSDALTFYNQRNKGLVDFESPVNIKGDLAVNNKVKIKGSDVGKRFERSEERIAGHDSVIGNHTNRLDRHRQELDQHEQWLYHHDDLFNKRGTKLDKFTKKLKGDGDVLTQHGQLIGQNGDRITNQQYTINSHGDLLTSHGTKLSQHDQEFIEKQSQIDDHTGRLNAHDNSLGEHQREINQINSNTNNIKDQMSEWSGFIDSINTWKSGGGIQISGISIYENRIYGNTASEQVLFHNYFGETVDIRAGTVYSQGHAISSDRSLKRDIKPVNSHDALSKVLNTDIKSWHYKDDKPKADKKIGPIIDDYNEDNNQKYYTPDDLINRTNDGDAFSLNNAISFLFLSVQELQKQNSQLSQRVAKLEFNK